MENPYTQTVDSDRFYSYTFSMKTAVSLPDDVFEQADRLAKRLKITRSQLYKQALNEYLWRHAPDAVKEALDRVCADLGSETDAFISEAGRRILEQSEWS